MASLSNWSLHDLTHRREIRSVASAFVGEIAAILHLIETHDVVSMVEKALVDSGPWPIMLAGDERADTRSGLRAILLALEGPGSAPMR